jgi:hypothetical protein
MADSGDKALGVLDKVLAYVDSPFKLIAVLVMGVVAFAGYFFWQNQSFLIDAYREQQRMPSINEDRVDDAASVLFKQTDAKFVAVFKVNPILGTRVLHRLYTKEGRSKDMEGLDVGLFTTNASNNNDVVKLMAGEVPCSQYLRAQSELGIWYMAQGAQYTCRISVPPDRSRFIGQITAGWASQPDNLEHIISMMTISATMLTKRGS